MANPLRIVDDKQAALDGARLRDAMASLDAGHVDDAAATLRDISVRLDTSVQVQAAVLLAALHAQRGDAHDVKAVLDAVYARAAQGDVRVDRGFAGMLYAHALRQLGDVDSALAAAVDAVAAGPTPGRLLVLADCQAVAGDVDAAIETLLRARSLDPRHVAVLGQLAGWGTKAGHDDAAAWRRAFDDVKGSDADSLRHTAFVCACAGDVDGAVAAIAAAAAAEPGVTAAYVDDEVAFDAFRDRLRATVAR
jgi:hypothetical protein